MEWKQVKGYESLYDLRSDGLLYSHPRPSTKGGYTYGSHIGNGYFAFKLTKNGATKRKLCNVLVYETFVGPIPKGYDVHHINGNRNDNRLSNLCLLERKKHLELHKENRINGVKKALSKPVLQYTLDGELIAEYSGVREAERQTGINSSYISACCLGKRKTTSGFVFRYVA